MKYQNTWQGNNKETKSETNSKLKYQYIRRHPVWRIHTAQQFRTLLQHCCNTTATFSAPFRNTNAPCSPDRRPFGCSDHQLNQTQAQDVNQSHTSTQPSTLSGNLLFQSLLSWRPAILGNIISTSRRNISTLLAFLPVFAMQHTPPTNSDQATEATRRTCC